MSAESASQAKRQRPSGVHVLPLPHVPPPTLPSGDLCVTQRKAPFGGHKVQHRGVLRKKAVSLSRDQNTWLRASVNWIAVPVTLRCHLCDHTVVLPKGGPRCGGWASPFTIWDGADEPG